MVCGIAPYDNNIVVLSYDEQDSIQEVKMIPHFLKIIDQFLYYQLLPKLWKKLSLLSYRHTLMNINLFLTISTVSDQNIQQNMQH